MQNPAEPNASKVICVLRFIILIGTLLPLSCARFPKSANTLSGLDDEHSIVFGKMEIFENGKTMSKPDLVFLSTILSHISHFTSDASLDKSRWSLGDYEFKTPVFKDGHFAFVVPPGKYYFVEFDYLDIFDAKPVLSIRTYMGQGPYLIVFDAIPNHATYIGTIRHNFKTQRNNWFGLEGSLVIDDTNGFSEATNWFLKKNPRFETNIVEGNLRIEPLSH